MFDGFRPLVSCQLGVVDNDGGSVTQRYVVRDGACSVIIVSAVRYCSVQIGLLTLSSWIHSTLLKVWM